MCTQCNLPALSQLSCTIHRIIKISATLFALFSFFCICCVVVYADGSICLDILQNRWSPTYDVSAILTSIQVTVGEPSVIWQYWLGIRKSIRPVKIEWWGVDVVICLEWGADCLLMVQLMPLPSQNLIISCFIYIQTGFTCQVPAYLGCPGKEAIKWV